MKILLIWILLLFHFVCFTQELAYISMSDNRIMSGDEVYDILQDKKGYIWLATAYGVIKYNGKENQIYTTKDGLVSNAIIKLYEDYRGNIWFISHRKGLSFFNGNEIRGHYLNPRIINLMFPGIIEQMHIDSAGNIYLSRNMGGIYKISTAGSITNIDTTESYHARFEIRLFSDKDLLISTKTPKQAASVKSIHMDNNKLLIDWPENIPSGSRKKILKIADNEYLFALNNQLLHIKNNKIISQSSFSYDITDLSIDLEKRLWVATLYDGVYVYKQLDLNKPESHFLQGKTVSRVLFDQNQHIWFTTLGNGVLMSLNSQVQLCVPVNRSDFVIKSFYQHGKQLFLNVQEQEVWTYNTENNHFQQIFQASNRTQNYKDLIVSNNNLYLLGSEFMQLDLNGKLLSREDISGRKLIKNKANEIYLLLFNHIRKTSGNKNTAFLLWENPLIYPTAMLIKNDTAFYIGTNEGLFYLSNDSLENMAYKHSFFNHHIQSLLYCKKRLIIASNGEGLGIYTNDSLKIISKKNGLSSDFINSIACQNDSIIWTAHNNGLNRIIFSADTFFIDVFNQQNGLELSNLNSLIYHENALWIASSKGLYKIERPEKMEIKSGTIVHLDSITKNGIKTKPKKRFVLNAGETLEFYFQMLEYVNQDNISLAYRVNSGDVYPFYGRSIKLKDLQAGEYQYELGTKDNHQFKPLFDFNVHVNEEYTESINFRISVLMIIAALMLLVFKFSLQYYRKKAASTENYLRNKQKALVSQLNPDFFYQSVETMRHLLSKGKNHETEEFLGNFHALLQGIIPSSNYNLVQLEKEIELITFYLSMVSLRYKNRFDSQFYCHELKNHQDIFVPPILALALVDAYVVNLHPALKHEMIISVKITNDICYFSVELMVYGAEMPAFFISNERLAFIEKRISLVKKLIGMNITIDHDIREDRNKHYLSEKRTLILPAHWKQLEKNRLRRWIKI